MFERNKDPKQIRINIPYSIVHIESGSQIMKWNNSDKSNSKKKTELNRNNTTIVMSDESRYNSWKLQQSIQPTIQPSIQYLTEI